MKKILLLHLIFIVIVACKDTPKTIAPKNAETAIDTKTDIKEKDTISKEVTVAPVKKSIKQIKQELEERGFKTYDYVDEITKDTVLMQQYFIAFLKRGAIRGQNEEETAELQKLHLAHLKKMYDLGYADISGPFIDDGTIKGITIYNVPTLKIADSLANSDPMVVAGRLEIEIHPWLAGKGFPLR